MKTKEMLYEWKSFLQKDMINEVSIKRFQEQHPEFDTTEFSSQLKGNTDYLDIISNSIAAGQNHSSHDYMEQFDFYKNSIEPNLDNQEFLTINIPGEIEPVSLAGKVNQGSCTATFDDIQQFQQARMFALGKGSKNKLAAAYTKVLEEASQDDFELIVDNNDWAVYYPKSIRGSIALARSYWDGSSLVYDNTFNPSKGYGQKIGRMSWCTSVSGAGNMFINYHRRYNLHMYYCIKKKVLDVSDETRKLCVSYEKTGEEVKMSEDNSSTVNANNNAINESYVVKCLGNTVSELLYKDVMLPKRKEVDMDSYYKSISLEQYITMRNAHEENIEDFANEFSNIIRLSKDKEKIKKYSINDNSEHIISALVNYVNSEEEITFLYDKWKNSNKVKGAFCNKAIALPESIFEEILSDANDDILAKLVSQVPVLNKVTDEIFDKLYDLCIRKNHRGLAFLIRSKRLSDEQISGIIEIIEKSDDSYTLNSSLLTCEELPLNIINALINSDDFRISNEAKTHYSKIKHDIENNDLSYLKNQNRRYKLSFFKAHTRKLLTPEILDILSNDNDFNVSETAKRYMRSIKRSRMYETRLLERYIRSILK